MRISTRIVMDWDFKILERDSYDYEGPLAECKGDGTAKDQLAEQNKLQQEAFDAQMGTLNSLKASLTPYLSGSRGYDPSMLAELNSQAINQNASKYNQAGNAVRASLAARGMNGQVPMGGGGVRGIASLEGAKASDLSNSLNTIGLNNSQQAINNQFNAASILSGNAGTLAQNTATFGSGASNALNQYVYAANQGFGGALSRGIGGALGGGLGSGIGAGISSGIGTALSGLGNGNYGGYGNNGYTQGGYS